MEYIIESSINRDVSVSLIILILDSSQNVGFGCLSRIQIRSGSILPYMSIKYSITLTFSDLDPKVQPILDPSDMHLGRIITRKFNMDT